MPVSEGEHPPAVRMLSGCQEAVNKLSREKIFFAQTHFLESTNQNTNVNTKIPKNRNRRNFSSGCQEAVKKLSTRCRRAVGPALRENPSSTEVKSCQSAPQGVSIDPCQADTKKFRPALLAVQGVFTLWGVTADMMGEGLAKMKGLIIHPHFVSNHRSPSPFSETLRLHTMASAHE